MAEEQASPEEKLLKVIQGSGDKKNEEKDSGKQSPSSNPAPAKEEGKKPAEKEQSKPVEKKEEKPKNEEAISKEKKKEEAAKKLAESLKASASEAKSEAKPEAKEDKKEEAKPEAKEEEKAEVPESIAAMDGMIGGSSPVIQGHKKKFEKIPVMTLVNRGLALASVLMICCSGWEIWANIQIAGERSRETSSNTGPENPTGVSNTNKNETASPGIEDILTRFSNGGKFVKPDAGVQIGVSNTTEVVVQVAADPIIKTMKENFTLMAVYAKPDNPREYEVIIVDKTDNKMHFLGVGDKMSVNGQDVELDQILGDKVTFKLGKEKVTIE